MAAGQSVSLVLTFDITQNTFQTVLQAAVLITTSGRPAAKVLTMFTFVCMSYVVSDLGILVGKQQAQALFCCVLTTAVFSGKLQALLMHWCHVFSIHIHPTCVEAPCICHTLFFLSVISIVIPKSTLLWALCSTQHVLFLQRVQTVTHNTC